MAASNPKAGGNFRLYMLGLVLVIWCFAIVGRLLYLQVFRYGDFEKRATKQQNRSFDLSPKRGIIYDRSGARTRHVHPGGFGVCSSYRNT